MRQPWLVSSAYRAARHSGELTFPKLSSVNNILHRDQHLTKMRKLFRSFCKGPKLCGYKRSDEDIILVSVEGLEGQKFIAPSNQVSLLGPAGDTSELRSLPQTRPRALTSLDAADPQLQCLLISRLPVEIRLVIWELALGSDKASGLTHLETVDGNLRSRRCWDDAGDAKLGFRHDCWEAGPWFRFREHPEKYQQYACFESVDVAKLRTLPLSCKLM